MIEFAGVPKAGKTTTIAHVQGFLKRCGFRVKVVVERASVCPLRDKQDPSFNIWTATTTLAQILEHTQESPKDGDPDILILDRGLFDAICWLRMMESMFSRLSRADREAAERFLLLNAWRKKTSAVVVMTASPEVSMSREQGVLPVAGRTGSIMNHAVLSLVRSAVEQTSTELKDQFRFFTVDTTQNGSEATRKTAEKVADFVLDLIEEHLSEDILSLPKTDVESYFGSATTIDSAAAQSLLRAFATHGTYQTRAQVENDSSRAQAIAVVVVRNKSGDVLLLRRRERDPASRLHDKLVIWAGGHIRAEDGRNGVAILRGAQRELSEELRLSIEPHSLTPLGAVYVRGTAKSCRHVALVFEWRAQTDNVAVTLSSAEFVERRGNSLSGRFVSVSALQEDVSSGKINEPWSSEIIARLFGPSDGPAAQLF